jgi:hypothetical protein
MARSKARTAAQMRTSSHRSVLTCDTEGEHEAGVCLREGPGQVPRAQRHHHMELANPTQLAAMNTQYRGEVAHDGVAGQVQ